jgi:hypothetical protein
MVPVVSWLALGLSAASLFWQVLSWIHSGPRLHVQFEHVRWWIPVEVPGLPWRHKEPRDAYAVTVTNDGRQSVTVQEVRVETKRSRLLPDHFIHDVVWGGRGLVRASLSGTAASAPAGCVVERVYHCQLCRRVDGPSQDRCHVPDPAGKGRDAMVQRGLGAKRTGATTGRTARRQYGLKTEQRSERPAATAVVPDQ